MVFDGCLKQCWLNCGDWRGATGVPARATEARAIPGSRIACEQRKFLADQDLTSKVNASAIWFVCSCSSRGGHVLHTLANCRTA